MIFINCTLNWFLDIIKLIVVYKEQLKLKDLIICLKKRGHHILLTKYKYLYKSTSQTKMSQV